MCRRWRRLICGFAIFSPWDEPKPRVGALPVAGSGPGRRFASSRPGPAARSGPGRWLTRIAMGNRRTRERRIRGRGSSGKSRARGLVFAAESGGSETSGGADARDRGAQPTGTPCNSRKAVVSVPCMNAPASLIEHSLLVIRQVSLQATSAQSSTGTAMWRLVPLMRIPLRPVASARAGRRMFLDPFRVVAARPVQSRCSPSARGQLESSDALAPWASRRAPASLLQRARYFGSPRSRALS